MTQIPFFHNCKRNLFEQLQVLENYKMAEEFSIDEYCESGNATTGLCEVNDDLQSLKTGVNTFFLIFAVRLVCPSTSA